MKTKEMILGAMLASLGLIIPLGFAGVLGISIPPFFSATLGAHVPLLLALTINPWVAITVAVIGAFGFFMKLGIIVAARAAMHIPIGIIGSILYKKGISFKKTLAILAPIHALCEASIVYLFGFSLYDAGMIVGVGTLIHHTLDSIIALGLYSVLKQYLPQNKFKIASS